MNMKEKLKNLETLLLKHLPEKAHGDIKDAFKEFGEEFGRVLGGSMKSNVVYKEFNLFEEKPWEVIEKIRSGNEIPVLIRLSAKTMVKKDFHGRGMMEGKDGIGNYILDFTNSSYSGIPFKIDNSLGLGVIEVEYLK